MKSERILSYCLSQKIAENDLESMTVVGGTLTGSTEVTHSTNGGWDATGDLSTD